MLDYIRLEHIREIAKCRLGIFVEKIDAKSSGWKDVERGIKEILFSFTKKSYYKIPHNKESRCSIYDK